MPMWVWWPIIINCESLTANYGHPQYICFVRGALAISLFHLYHEYNDVTTLSSSKPCEAMINLISLRYMINMDFLKKKFMERCTWYLLHRKKWLSICITSSLYWTWRSKQDWHKIHLKQFATEMMMNRIYFKNTILLLSLSIVLYRH